MAVPSRLGPVTGDPRIDPERCTGCGACTRACPTGVLAQGEPGIVIDREAGFGCIACGHCMMVCPRDAIAVTGRGFDPSILTEIPRRSDLPTPESLDALLLRRRSVRRYRPEPVSRDVIRQVVEAAALAPMAIPPSEIGIVVFDTPDRVRALANLGVAIYRRLLRMMDHRVARALLRLSPKGAWFVDFLLPLGRQVVAAADRGEDHLLYKAPACLLFHQSRHADPADVAIAITTAMLAAEARGLGTCIIGALPGPLARNGAACRRAGIPAGHVPAGALILGWPDVTFRKAIRRPLASVRWD